MSRVSFGASRTLIMYASAEIADRLQGGLSFRVSLERDHLVIRVTGGGENGRLPRLRLRPKYGDYVAACGLEHVQGWGRGCPLFTRTDAQSARMIEEDGVPTLLCTMPAVMSRPVQRATTRGRRQAELPLPGPPVPVTGSVDLATLVRSINEIRRQMGDSLVLSIVSDGTLRATVEYG